MNFLKDFKQKCLDIYHGNKERGFWDEPRTFDQCFTLAISELFEALEADRKSKWCKVGAAGKHQMNMLFAEGNIKQFEANFVDQIKDTVQDEVADCIIRFMDWIGYCIEEKQFYAPDGKMLQKVAQSICDDISVPDTKGNAFFEYVSYVIKLCYKENIMNEAYEAYEKYLAYVISIVLFFNTDIDWHIENKLRFNAGRGIRHGKKY